LIPCIGRKFAAASPSPASIGGVWVNAMTASFATATIGGSAQAVFANSNYISKTYEILTATGGVSGTFSGLSNNNLPNNFSDALSYDANNAYLNLTLNFVPPPSGHPVSEGIDVALPSV
jgi:hypothetical protein